MKTDLLDRKKALNRNFSSVCRLCLRETNLKLNMFEGEGLQRDVNEKILSCLSLIVSESDRLPKYVCHSCLDKLDSFQDFRDQCHEAENILHSYLASSEAKSSSPWSTVSKHTSVEIEPPRLDFVNVPVKVEAEERIIPKSENLRSCDFSGAVNSFDAFGGSQTTSGPSNNLQSVVGAFVSPDEVCQSISTVQGSQDVPSESVSFSEAPEERFYSYNSDIAGQSQSVPDSYSDDDDDDIQILDDDDSMGGEQKSVPEAAAGGGSSSSRYTPNSAHNSHGRGEPHDRNNEASFANSLENVQLASCTQIVQGVQNTRKYMCKLCSKSYNRKHHLWRHILIHTGQKPFVCIKCDRQFSREDNLRRHCRVACEFANSPGSRLTLCMQQSLY